MRILAALLIAAATLPITAPAAAQERGGRREASLPTQLDASERAAYREIFAAIRAQDWVGAKVRLDSMREGPLHAAARAELYTAAGSPRVEAHQVLPLLQSAPELPHAEQLARLAQMRGAIELPPLPPRHDLVGLRGQPRRARPRPIRGDEVAARIEPEVQQLIVADQPAAAESILRQNQHSLSDEARTAFQQRIAWSYYLIGDDRSARRLANEARHGPTEYAVHSEWVAALASWRLQDCEDAAEGFGHVAERATDVELAAAGHYWAARAEMACARPQQVQARLRNAARHGETFYGLLAARALGLRGSTLEDASALTQADWTAVRDERNIRTALALVEIGEHGLADKFIRHQARIGNPREHQALIQLSARLNLTSTQMWLAHNAPRGVRVHPLARYPTPDWQPARGWRVDPNLAFAHALQESNFRPEAVSPAGARGLMQVMPGTASDVARRRGESVSPGELNDPRTNIEYGQTYLEYLRDLPHTGGLLPRVIAAYNAGPAPVSEWTGLGIGQGDPLLYLESLPYWETRGYVPIVLRNYWIYEQRSGRESASREALVQGMWPRFPGLPGPTAVRLQPPNSNAGLGQR